MKNLVKSFLILLLLGSVVAVNAQNKKRPWTVGISVSAVDFESTGAEGNKTANGFQALLFNEFFNAKDHYNFAPSIISSINVGRYLGRGFTLDLSASYSKITTIGNTPEINPGDWPMYGGDLNLKYDILNLFGNEKCKLRPFTVLGGGYTLLDGQGNPMANGGLGFDVMFTDVLGLFVQSEYKHSFDDAFKPFFQHNVGIKYLFGGKDSDKDGVLDDDDECPEVFGLKEFKGCPDTDEDGVKDKDDLCPKVAGPVEFNGCPDTDGDGVVDIKDECPKIPGTKANKGCPDTDGDGVIDKKDACPKVKGEKANKGCPWPDTDKDGILDKDDKCPNVAGLEELQGCPADKESIKDKASGTDKVSDTEGSSQTQTGKDSLSASIINTIQTVLYFNTESASITSSEIPKLNALIKALGTHPVSISLEGHADDRGDAGFNQDLSEQRAEAIKRFLLNNGVSNDLLQTVGFGEMYPVETNTTDKGRSKNRRVEVKIK